MTDPLPIFWSFRRCPYAMRARLALQAAGQRVELREILLRDKPQAFLDTSPSGTVPVLRDGEHVLDESLDIMIWALRRADPLGWLEVPQDAWPLISRNDGPFKSALDRTKYAVRFPDSDPAEAQQKAVVILQDLNDRLQQTGWLFGKHQTIADAAILPFIRQFANTDRAWFDAQDWPHLIAWLDRFLASTAFQGIMTKYKPWADDPAPIFFP